jgi:hypothetical protein
METTMSMTAFRVPSALAAVRPVDASLRAGALRVPFAGCSGAATPQVTQKRTLDAQHAELATRGWYALPGRPGSPHWTTSV